MRPVNLIPPEDRRGDKAPMRTGNLAYVLVGGLAVLLLAVIATALTSKQISDKESEQQGLEQELVQATARADSLKAFADFRAVQETRAATVSSLAQSRFDWERVIRELSLVLPSDVQLVGMSGSVSAEVQPPESEGVSLRSSIPGPALELTGCAPGQDAVAALIAALEDIDGVTRVGLASSERADDSEGTAGGGATDAQGAEGEDDQDCRVADFISKFQIVVAFDAVPTPGTATAAPSVPAPAAPSGQDAQLADAQTEQAVSRASAKEQTAKADEARHNLVPGG
jgi:Tfp pilus assembly protein PilN